MTFLVLLHLLAAVFIAGPLTAAAMTAGRYARSGDASALRMTARSVTVFGWASLAVAIFGLAAVPGNVDGSFGALWIQISTTLYLVAFGITMGMLAPALRRTAAAAESGEPTTAAAGRLAAIGGVVSLLFLVIVVLMVYKP